MAPQRLDSSALKDQLGALIWASIPVASSRLLKLNPLYFLGATLPLSYVIPGTKRKRILSYASLLLVVNAAIQRVCGRTLTPWGKAPWGGTPWGKAADGALLAALGSLSAWRLRPQRRGNRLMDSKEIAQPTVPPAKDPSFHTPQSLRELMANGEQIEELRLRDDSKEQISSELLEQVAKRFSQLRCFKIDTSAYVPNKMKAIFQSCQGLEELYVSGLMLSSDSLEGLEGLSQLKVIGGQLSSSAVQKLTDIQSLEEVRLEDQKGLVTDLPIRTIGAIANLPKIRVLHLDGHQCESKDHLAAIPETTKLKELGFTRASFPWNSSPSYDRLQKFSMLKRLRIPGPHEGLQPLPALEQLHLSSGCFFNHQNRTLTEWTSLRHLILDRVISLPDDIGQLHRLPKLERLTVHGWPLGEKNTGFTVMTKLKQLYVTVDSSFTPERLWHLVAQAISITELTLNMDNASITELPVSDFIQKVTIINNKSITVGAIARFQVQHPNVTIELR